MSKPLLTPFARTAMGIKAFTTGLVWLRGHKRHLMLLMLPMALAFFFLVGGLSLFFDYDTLIMDAILFAKPESWYMLALYYLCYGLLYFASLVMVPLAAFLFMNVIASPFYEVVSVAVERDYLGYKEKDLSIFENLKVMVEELKKVLFILLISIALLFLPGINVISVIFSAFLIGWDYYDYPLARRGWSFRQRFVFVLQNFWSVMGLGLWLVIPFVQVFLLPFAVVGGTRLALEDLVRKGLVTRNGA